MRFVPTRIHGILDYLTGGLLIVMPWLFGFAQGGAETWVPVVLGAGVILYSLMTDYEWGVARVFGMSVHLWLDGWGGFLLAVSPWLFAFRDVIIWPHLIIGIFEVVAAITTRATPAKGSRRTRSRVR